MAIFGQPFASGGKHDGRESRLLSLHVPTAELQKRRAVWSAPPPRFTRGVLAKYARVVSSASRGAVTDPD